MDICADVGIDTDVEQCADVNVDIIVYVDKD
jgi:hypothetical protein